MGRPRCEYPLEKDDAASDTDGGYAFDNDAESQAMEVVEMNENIDFVPDDAASHVWTERDSELVEQYAAQLMSMNIG